MPLPDQWDFFLSAWATRAFTSFLTSDVGRGLPAGKRMVPLDLEKGFSSFVNFSMMTAVGNRLQ